MIDSHINPSLESWVITTATRPNTEFQIPANIPNGSELYDTVRKTSDKNIPANNEVEKRLGLFEPMETCLTWTQWVSTKTVIIHTHFILETTVTVCHSSALRNTGEKTISVSSLPQRDLSAPQILVRILNQIFITESNHEQL